MEGKTIGIDFGSKKIITAYCNETGDAVEVTDTNMNKEFLSCVAFTGQEPLFGTEAQHHGIVDPKNTIFGGDIKKVFKDPKLSSLRVIQDKDGASTIIVDYENEQKLLYPEQILAMLLTKVRKTAETHLLSDIQRCVITTPSCFTSQQHLLVKTACKLAGYNEASIINDTTAAAIVYAMTHQSDQGHHILIYDIGATYTEASIAYIDGKSVNIKASTAEMLGSDSFIQTLVEFFTREIRNEISINIDDNAIVHLQVACEEILKQLSTKDYTIVMLDKVLETPYELVMTRKIFELICANHFRRIVEIARQLFEASMLYKSTIHVTCVMGGGSKIPKVESVLKEFMEVMEISRVLDKNEVIAIGAAYYGAGVVEVEELKKETEDEVEVDIVKMRHVLDEFETSRVDQIEPEQEKVGELTIKDVIEQDTPLDVSVDDYEAKVSLKEDSEEVQNVHVDQDEPNELKLENSDGNPSLEDDIQKNNIDVNELSEKFISDNESLNKDESEVKEGDLAEEKYYVTEDPSVKEEPLAKAKLSDQEDSSVKEEPFANVKLEDQEDFPVKEEKIVKVELVDREDFSIKDEPISNATLKDQEDSSIKEESSFKTQQPVNEDPQTKQVHQIEEENPEQALFDQGVDLFTCEDYKNAYDIFTSCIQISKQESWPKHITLNDLHSYRAQCSYYLQNYEKCCHDYNKIQKEFRTPGLKEMFDKSKDEIYINKAKDTLRKIESQQRSPTVVTSMLTSILDTRPISFKTVRVTSQLFHKRSIYNFEMKIFDQAINDAYQNLRLIHTYPELEEEMVLVCTELKPYMKTIPKSNKLKKLYGQQVCEQLSYVKNCIEEQKKRKM